MITMEENSLIFRFPEVHSDAWLRVSFKRTLRVPDDGQNYPLPAGLGSFPLRHVDDYSANLSSKTLERGGALMPMWLSEALWISFSGPYPFAVKVATGKVNAITGSGWTEHLTDDPQDYLVVPAQPWIDGFCVEKGRVRQFVAMPLGEGKTVEEQITGEAEFGGLQILAQPLKPEHYKPMRRFGFREGGVLYSIASSQEVGLAAGGSIRQDVYEDPYGLSAWYPASSRVFVTLLNAEHWAKVTGELPPTTPINAKAYARARIPWFDWYAADQKALRGSIQLRRLKRLTRLGRKADTKELRRKNEWSIDIGPDVRPVREVEILMRPDRGI